MLGALTIAIAAMGLDLAALWDFRHPAVSEARFRAALPSAVGDDALILWTQIARTHGLRKDFGTARAILASVAGDIARAGPEARVRYDLELGRTYASAVHTPDQLTPAAKALARAADDRALALARSAQLDGLAVDALHMLAFVDTAPAEQLAWGRQALAIVDASPQPAAKAWEASLRNNVGLALHRLGRFDEALVEFDRARTLRQRGSDAEATRAADWMVAWTLRALGRSDEALAIQARLERDCDAAGVPDRFVYEELEILHRQLGGARQADRYLGLWTALAAEELGR